MESALTVLLYTCRELHLVKPTETRKRQITSLRETRGWELGPGSPFAHSTESHLRWVAVLHGKAGKQQGKFGLFQPQGSWYFSFKHLWGSQAKRGREGDTARELERAVKHPNLNGDPAVQGYKKGFSCRWTRRGIPGEEWDYSLLNKLFSCCLLISLLIPPFLLFHICLHLQPHIHLHSLWAAHNLCPLLSLPPWSSSQHQWLCPSHRQVCPAHPTLDFDSWCTFGISTSHPLKFHGL